MTIEETAQGLAHGADIIRRLTNAALEYERTSLVPVVFPMTAQEGFWFIESLSRAVMLLERLVEEERR